MNCKICNYKTKKTLQKHIEKNHNISIKEYYDLYDADKTDVFSKDILDKLRRLANWKKTVWKSPLKGIPKSENHKCKLKASHWANKPDYNKTKHPLYGKHLGGYNKGVPMSKKQKEILRQQRLGKKHTKEHNIKIGLGVKNSKKFKESMKKIGWKISKSKMGHIVSEETKEKIRRKHIGKKLTIEHKYKIAKGCKDIGKKKYKYNGISYRSKWEVAFAKRLDNISIDFLYEPKIFKLGNIVYIPDFYLINYDRWIEIKGYLKEKDKNKINTFKDNGYILDVLRSLEAIKSYTPLAQMPVLETTL